MPRRLPCSLLLAGLLGAGCEPGTPPPSPPPPPAEPGARYSTEVRPLLARKCLPCHGRLEAANHSGVRLDSRELATRRRDLSGAQPVFPGDPARSALLQKLFVVAPDDPTTPTDPAHTVTPEEHDLLSRWIRQGAYYEAHWAFQPLPEEVPLPEARWPGWAQTPFDLFSESAADGGGPLPPDPPRRWLHRAALDLTGLPPAPAVLEEFERNLRENSERTALQTAVDQLLASTAFGEHLATRWLQDARYSDLLAASVPAHQQAYRNWVALAFNNNLPYDQFLARQVAGDLQETPSDADLVATGFQRLHPLPPSAERPVDVSVARRTDAFARAVLGLETSCARCHDHPHDPLGPDDHRALRAFFGNTGETGVIPPAGVVPTPSHLLLNAARGDELHTHTQAEADTMQALERTIEAGQEDFAAWLAAGDQLPLISDLAGAFAFDRTGDAIPNTVLDGDGTAGTGTLPRVPGLRGQALELDGRQAVILGELFPLTRADPFTVAFWLKLPALPAGPVRLLDRTGGTGRGLALLLADGHLEARIFREWPGNALGIRTTSPVLAADAWHQVAWSYDGSSTAEGLRLFVDGREAPASVTANHAWKSAVPPGAAVVLGGDAGLAGTLLDDLQVFTRALTPPELAHLHDGRSLTGLVAAGEPAALKDYYFSSIHAPARALARELPVHRRALVAAEDLLPELAVMRRAGPPETSPATPGFLPPLPVSGGTPDRRDLAAWLTGPSHPLTARLFVNRLWENFLGDPFVATAGDLGMAGAAPARRDQLDWLARDFVNHGWDVKDLCRRIVLSSTYRQAQPVALDPVRFRDRTLAATGLLSTPAETTPFVRSLYQRWPLPGPSSPHPCPGSEPPPRPGQPEPLGAGERAAILTRVLSGLEAQAPGHDAGRLAFLFRSLTGREATVTELALLGAVAREEKARAEPGQSPWPAIAARLLEGAGHEVIRRK